MGLRLSSVSNNIELEPPKPPATSLILRADAGESPSHSPPAEPMGEALPWATSEAGGPTGLWAQAGEGVHKNLKGQRGEIMMVWGSKEPLQLAAGEAHTWLCWAQLRAQLLQALSQSRWTAGLGLLRDRAEQTWKEKAPVWCQVARMSD